MSPISAAKENKGSSSLWRVVIQALLLGVFARADEDCSALIDFEEQRLWPTVRRDIFRF